MLEHETAHECVYVEEQEPSGRLILPPCIVCGCTAMDALEQLRGERLRAVGWWAPWQLEAHVLSHLNSCDGCSASIHRHAKRTYVTEADT